MPRYRLLLEWDGRPFMGWQQQAHGPSVQGAIEDAAARFLGAEVAAVAKRDLKAGETLDQIGEYTYRAWAMEVSRARAAQALPAGLLTGAVTTAPIRKGELITALNTRLPANARIVELRRRQDEMLYGREAALA